MTPELIQHLHEWIINHPQVVNSPISNDIILVPGHKQPGNKIRFSILLLHISICKIHNYLIYESSIFQLKEAVDESTGKPLISDTAIFELIPKNAQK